MRGRRNDPLKQWKISQIDKEELHYWKDYSEARNEMFLRTNFKKTAWFVVKANDKRKARIAIISHLLLQLNYRNKDDKLVSKDYGLVYPISDQTIRRDYTKLNGNIMTLYLNPIPQEYKL